MKVPRELRTLTLREYENFRQIAIFYGTGKKLMQVKRWCKNEMDADLHDAKHGGIHAVIRVLAGDPFVRLNVPLEPTETTEKWGLEAGRDAQMAIYDLVGNIMEDHGLLVGYMDGDYDIYVPFNKEDCLAWGMKESTVWGGTKYTDPMGLLPDMYSLFLTPVEKAKAVHDLNMWQKRWDRWDRKHGFARDENDKIIMPDGSKASDEAILKARKWDDPLTRYKLDIWKQEDKEYEDKYLLKDGKYSGATGEEIRAVAEGRMTREEVEWRIQCDGVKGDKRYQLMMGDLDFPKDLYQCTFCPAGQKAFDNYRPENPYWEIEDAILDGTVTPEQLSFYNRERNKITRNPAEQRFIDDFNKSEAEWEAKEQKTGRNRNAGNMDI